MRQGHRDADRVRASRVRYRAGRGPHGRFPETYGNSRARQRPGVGRPGGPHAGRTAVRTNPASGHAARATILKRARAPPTTGPMPISATARPTVPPTVRTTRGRYVGERADETLRRGLSALKAAGAIDDFLELPEDDTKPDLVFESRTRVGDGVTVRARLALSPPGRRDRTATGSWSPRRNAPGTPPGRPRSRCSGRRSRTPPGTTTRRQDCAPARSTCSRRTTRTYGAGCGTAPATLVRPRRRARGDDPGRARLHPARALAAAGSAAPGRRAPATRSRRG